MHERILVAVLCLHLVLSVPVFAQTSNATLGGTVSDATGALIPGVSVTATNVATGIVTTVLTNEAGAYQFASLQTGTYKVVAELSGFQTQTYNNVTLGISQQVRLNFTLQVGSVAQAVEVTVAADTAIATSSSSIGTVLPEYKIRDLPLGTRNVMDLLLTNAGISNAISGSGSNDGASPGDTGYFAGGRLSAVNVTRDGFTVTDQRYNHGAFSVTYVSPDLVEEVRVITAPVDSEVNRGSGQIQMVTRSGGNQFRGSAFWTNRNSAGYANTWFNNFAGADKDYENRNQFGVRFGGPIIKNKTFFFILVDEQRDVIKQTWVAPVLTAQARQGIFRFFPGADNQNATAINPTVDRNGNPVRPPNAIGDLQSFNIFKLADGSPRDPNRTGYDSWIQSVMLPRMPLPNDFTNAASAFGNIGGGAPIPIDGLNMAGYRWTRRISGFDLNDGNGYDTNRDQFNMRLDHNFNANHKASFIYTWERDLDMTTQAGIPAWPGGYYGENNKWPKVINGSLVSTFSSNFVNELRVGYKNTRQYSNAPWWAGKDFLSKETPEPTARGQAAFDLLPKYNGIPVVPQPTLFPQNFMNMAPNAGTTRFNNSPQYSYGDTLSFTKGAHAFKVGGEWRYGYTLGGNEIMMPVARLGAGGPAVANITALAVTGLTANNQALARNILTDLSGSVASINEAFDVRNATERTFRGFKDGLLAKRRDLRATEFSLFWKDNWKIRSDFTLNLGIHYEWFGVPYERHGLAGLPVGREAGLCGYSCGALTTAEFVGKYSDHPDVQLYNDSWKNVAPAVGFSWSLPWLGKDKSVLRAGYGWSYVGRPLIGANSANSITGVAGGVPGTFGGSGNGQLSYTQAGYLSLANLSVPIPQQFQVLGPIPIDGSRNDVLAMYATNRRSPYIQNFTVGIDRELAQDWILNVSYVGTKGTRLWGGINLNTDNIFNNEFLDAFNLTRAGGNAPLFDRMLYGLNIPGAGVVNGTSLTGSAALRAYTGIYTPPTGNTAPSPVIAATAVNTLIANGSVGHVADFLNRSTSITGKGGGFVRNGGLPENFFVLNPQFNYAVLSGNPASSTYHSLMVQMTKRISRGFTLQSNYTWSRALGENDGDYFVDYRDPNNRRLNHSLLGFHRTHAIQSNGTWELPFGPNHLLLNNAPNFIQRLVERWQLGGILTRMSGTPLNITSLIATMTQGASVSTPNIVGDFPKSTGHVTKVANGVTYFPGLQQIIDPSAASVGGGLAGAFSNKAIRDAQGRLLLTNPAPGQIGSLGLKWIEGPPFLQFDMNLIKRIRMTETKEFEVRIDAANILNHPNFGDPETNINSPNFGRITTLAGQNTTAVIQGPAVGNRRFTVGARLNF